VAQERDRAAIRHARQVWITRRQPRMRVEPHRLVFIDETSVKTNLTRLRGRAPRGKRLHGTAPFGKWQTQTFIAGLTSDELIPTCTDQNPCAHLRMPMEMIFHGRSMSLFQASQQRATMSS